MKRLIFLLLLVPSVAFGWGTGNDVYKSAAVDGAAAPAFNSEIAQSRLTETSDTATSTITVDAVAQGGRVVVAAWWYSSTQTLSSVTDTRSNTYTVDVQRNNDGTANLAIASANAGTALQSGDTITLNWGSSAFTYRAASAFSLTGCATTGQPDGTPVQESSYGTTLQTSGTVADDSAQLGIVAVADKTYSSPATGWYIEGSVHTTGNSTNLYYFYGEHETGASVSPGGTISSAESYMTVWASYD